MDSITIQTPEIVAQLKDCKPGETVIVTLTVDNVVRSGGEKAKVIAGEGAAVASAAQVELSGTVTSYEKSAPEVEEEEESEEADYAAAKPIAEEE